MKKFLSIGAGLVCFAAAASMGSAQQLTTERPAQPSNQPILLDVVVTGKSGKPVAGLQPQDFTVLDDGHPAKILSFHPHDTAVLKPSEVDASTEIIFILDEVNATYQRVIYARQGIESYLKQNNGQLNHPVLLGLFTDSGLQLQTEPSVDGNAMAAALEKQGQTYGTIARGALFGDSERLQISQDALQSLIAQEQNKPGRKIVLWVSPGWPLLNGPRAVLSANQMNRIFNTVVKLSTGLRQARITLYSVDPLGAASTGEHSVYYENFTKALTQPDNAQLGVLGLQVLVEQTGGRAIFGNDTIESSIDRCTADLNAFYTLAIEAAPSEAPNQFHSLEVRVPPGLKARTRNGYYAQP